jgi:tetratricopeptide (TPR) repeat protein
MDFEQLFRKGTQLLHQGKVMEARPFLEQAHELAPDHKDAALNLSGVYILTKKFRKAVAILEPLSEQHPDETTIWTNLGAAYLGNPVLARDAEQLQAIDAFEKALRTNPVAPNVAYNVGLIYRDRKETDQAIAWFKKAIRANPNDRDARNLLSSLTDKEK